MCETCGCRPLARSRVYEFISAGFSYPDSDLLGFLQGRLLETENCLFVLEDGSGLEALRTLRPVIASGTHDKLEMEYIQTFGHTISKECPPYEAEYGQAHIFQKSHTLADIAGFYRAFGLEMASSFNDRLDYISVELEFMHFLCLKEAYALTRGHPEEQLVLCRESQTKFLTEHLGLWALAFVERLEKKAKDNFYGLMGRLLDASLSFDMRTLGVKPGKAGSPVFVEPSDEDTLDCEACPLLVSTPERGGQP